MAESSHFALVVPAHTVRWFPEGEHCADPKTGDILLVDHGTFASTLIEDAQKIATWRSPELDGYTWCSHAAVVRTDLGAEPMVSEMGFKGYERRPLLDYRARLYAVVSFASTEDQRWAAARFDDAMSGADYGWLLYPAIAIDDALGTQLSMSWSDHIICSAHAMLVASALGFMGDRLATRTEPMRVALWVGAKH